MEKKLDKLRIDERCKKLERSLRLSFLRKSARTTNKGQASLFRIPSSISSSNTGTQDSNYSASFTQTFQTENVVVPSTNNLCNIMATKKNMYNLDNQLVTSPNIKQPLMEKNHFDRESVALLSLDTGMPHGQFKANPKIPKTDLLKNRDYLRSPMAKNSCSLLTKDKDDSDSVINPKVKNARNNNIDNKSLPKLRVSNIKSGHGRTFSNWRVMLNDQGNLLLKGRLESGKVAHSKPISKRLTATSVQSIFNHTYHLDGTIVDSRNELPEYVRGKFHSGFPDDWENVHQIWLLYVSNGSKPSFHWPTKITDSDDDIKSEMTDSTFLCPQKKQKQHSKLDVILKKQIPNDSNGHLFPTDVCSNDWKAHTSEAKTTGVSRSQIHKPTSKSTFISSAKMEVPNLNIWNKENQYKCESGNMHKIFFHKKNTMRDIIKQDKIDIIIRNLLHKDCPKEYILKILQVFHLLDDVISFRIGTDETNEKSYVSEEFSADLSENNKKESVLYGEQIQDNKTEINLKSFILERHNISPKKQYIEHNENNRDVYNISSKTIKKQSKDLRNTSEEVNDMHLPQLQTKDADDSDNETYAGVPKIMSDCILKSRERLPFRRYKYMKKRKTTDVNPITWSDSKSNKRFKEDRTRIHRSNSSNDDIENTVEDRRKDRQGNKTKSPASAPLFRENPGNIHYESSVSITEDEGLQVEEKLACSGVCKRKETNNFVYKRILDISSTDEEIKLSNSTYNCTKEPKIVNNYDGTNCINDGNTEDNIRSYVDVGKCNVFKNYCSTNTNKCVPHVESAFSFTTSNGKERNKDYSKSKFNDINDCYIKRSKNSSRVCQTPRGYERQIEPGKTREKDKSMGYKKVMEARNRDNKSLEHMEDSAINKLMSTAKCKLLSNWIPRVVYNSQSNSELGLVFEGKLLNEAGHVVHRKFVTEHIHKRLSPVDVVTTNRELYQLVGDLHDPEHVLPKEIVKLCRKGCPSDINQFCKFWKSLQKEDESGESMSREEIEIATDLLNLPTSSRGRKRFPPLRYWDGERVAVKDNKVVYISGNCKNSSTGLLTDNTKDQSV